MAKAGTSSLKLAGVVIWLITTLSLATWWIIYGLKQIERINALNTDSAQELARQHSMLMWEGGFLILLLLGGGLGLLYFVYVEMRRVQQVKEFFARFTHDLKTSLASLRLQAETLEEDLKDSTYAKTTKRIVKDTVRLELQLENSLFVANAEVSQLYFEDVSLTDLISSIKHHWPELRINLSGNGILSVDIRAIESILKNVIQNAVIHGHATEVTITVEPYSAGSVRLIVCDNGEGFNGDESALGRIFVRHGSRSGSGIGLYLVKVLAARMGGSAKFIKGTNNSFMVELILQGRVS